MWLSLLQNFTDVIQASPNRVCNSYAVRSSASCFSAWRQDRIKPNTAEGKEMRVRQ